MTYEEYKNSKTRKRSILKELLNKLFTCIIFTMIILIISNTSPRFKSFLVENVLNNTMDFSGFNKTLNKVTSVFKSNKTKTVSSISNDKEEKYLDGVKYIIDDNTTILAKDSGIVTFIGKKDGYNNTIIIQQSNGYYAWYGNVKESIKLYDYIEKGSIIGTSSKEYYYALFKNDKKVSINEN